MLTLHTGMEKKKLSVPATAYVNLNHICALFERNFICRHGVAGNIAAAGTPVSNNDYIFFWFFSEIKTQFIHPKNPILTIIAYFFKK